ncbi:MAG: hypothetical protein JSU01_20035 [Bacteroidetes bacterium]|nr:hypothetical protein [Bacteroidota bacterium]
MPPFLSKSSKIRLNVLAWYQIIGGILGLVATCMTIVQAGQVNALIIFIILFAIGLYVFSMYAGRLLFTSRYPTGLRLSKINQIAQIPQIAMLGYAFWYVSGSMFAVGIKVADGFTFDFNFGLMSTWQMSIASGDRYFLLAVNVVAIFWLYFIAKLKRDIQDDEDFFEPESVVESNETVPDNEIVSGTDLS